MTRQVIDSSGYSLLDAGNFRKLEQIGSVVMIRPAAGAIWLPKDPGVWGQKAQWEFTRNDKGNGQWQNLAKRSLPAQWQVSIAGLTMVCRGTEFGHIGLFPEHLYASRIGEYAQKFAQKYGRPLRLLNLFAYTGLLTLVAAKAGAEVVHVDASKTSVAWARDNAVASNLADRPIRWITDDATKFCQREVRRGRTYDAIILDPPSYGRGTAGEVWQVESALPGFLATLAGLFSPEFAYLQLSSHTPGLTPLTLQRLVADVVGRRAGTIVGGEAAIPIASGNSLPSGAFSLFCGDL